MTRVFAGLALGLGSASWISAIGVGLYAEYRGWRKVLVEDEIAGGLAIALLGGPAAFTLTQAVFGLPAAGFAALAERSQRIHP